MRPSYRMMTLLLAGGIALFPSASAIPSKRTKRAQSNITNAVLVDAADNHCLIVPKNPHTDIGDSEYPGGTTVYCTPSAHSSDEQGVIPPTFWKNIEFSSGTKAGRYAQLTGCIDPTVLDRINSNDPGGQYDSSGGSSGTGNPAGSVCSGYNHYVELVEPAGPRACIRCCDDPDDCPIHEDKTGCPKVIPGNYFDCA